MLFALGTWNPYYMYVHRLDNYDCQKKGKKQCAHLKAFALGTWNPYMYVYGQDNKDCQKKVKNNAPI